MSGHFLGANPILPVKSVADTLHFFKEQLGFNIIVMWTTPPYGVVQRGATVIEFGEGRQAYAGSGVCNIHVDCADAIYREWKAKDVEFIDDLADRDYGRRDFRIRDNNANMLIIGHDLANHDELITKGNAA